jgi:hypothetical protein
MRCRNSRHCHPNIAGWKRRETSQEPTKIRPKIPAKGRYRSEEQHFHDFFMRHDLDFQVWAQSPKTNADWSFVRAC